MLSFACRRITISAVCFVIITNILMTSTALFTSRRTFSITTSRLRLWKPHVAQSEYDCSRKFGISIPQTRSTSCLFESSKPYYITTPIYYVNGEPHLGHAYTSVIADIMARFSRLDGRPTLFLTGTDEHGQKVEQSATAAGKSPIEFADEVSSKFRNLASVMQCSNNDFIRTTENRHKEAVNALWKRLEDNGEIYLGAYEGWYSIRDEAFYAESELVDGKAPTGAPVQWVKEESYFFKLSAWTEKLLEFYDKNPDFIGPKSRRNEVVSFVSQEGGLRDLSISRTTFSWGIPVKNDPKHVVYVWLDALTNYLSAVGYPDQHAAAYKQFWPASVHLVGKDILRFHAIFWPAFLLAAGLEPPQRIFAHGWWTKDGEKMSKSIGNVLDPLELVAKYGVDYVRYYLASEIIFGNDGDFSDTSFCNRINSDLANDIGNLAQRVLTMIQKNCDGRIPAPGTFTSEDERLLQAAEGSIPIIREAMHNQNIKQVCEQIVDISKQGNKYIDSQAPWTLRKTDLARFNTVMYVLVEVIRRIAILLNPITPSSSNNMLDQLGAPVEMRTLASMQQLLSPGLPIGSPSPVFPKLDNTAAAQSSSESNIIGDPPKNAKSTSSTTSSKKSNKNAPAISQELIDQYSRLALPELSAMIIDTGVAIRNAKSNPAANKDDLQKQIGQLLALKESYKIANGGKPFEG